MRISEIPEENRPRERLLKNGPSVLSDAELLAVVLRSGTQGENVVDMSNRLIAEYGIGKLSSLTPREMQKIKGMGPAKAAQISALFELSRRAAHSACARRQMKSGRDVYEYVKDRLPGNDREYFMALHLDSKNRVIKDEVISVGTLNASIVHPREVFKNAIRENTNSVILAHNHPSGDPRPSPDDREITKQLREAGRIVEIEVLDHVIVGEEGYYSFREKGMNL